eukprot:TRINITY_DN7977_c0_g1_i1.p1 TRINITY_DN7977_c0_g1~~TRINITY_DN7977_c0_g1_i1.p1  ORF type:complete len:382 (-),score=71.96 TRINITY_DN7977_c0_g1_i1:157-1302(-)
MKLVKRNFNKDGEGSIQLIAEENEDMWHAYNLIRAGDNITANTFRKISRDTGAGSSSEKIKLKLTLKIEDVDFDPEGGSIRLKGRNLSENEHIKLLAYHTIELEVNRPFTIFKTAWDQLDIDRIKQITDPGASADLAAVLITEGLAHVCLVGQSVTIIKQKIEVSLPKKRGPAVMGYDRAWDRFLNNTFEAVIRCVDFEVVKCLVIAGPGFAKDSFREYVLQEGQRRGLKQIIENKDRILVTHASNAYKQALNEVLEDPGVARQIKDTKAASEVNALQSFFETLGQDSSRAFYGPGHVFAAFEAGGIATLLITDSLFRVNDIEKRRRYSQLVEGVRDAGGECFVFSAMHISGEQLNQISGIAAILRFPMPDIEEQEIPAPF